MTSKKLTGYKAFDNNWKCRDKQYAIGKTFRHTGKVALCDGGLHFCENPLDLFSYYPPTSNFAVVEASGVSSETSDDSKRVARSLTLQAEIKLPALIDAGVKFILSKVDFENAKESNTGDYSAATNTGYQSAATNTGYQSAATNTGTRSAATNTGYQSAATNTGYQSAATNTGYQSAATNTGTRSAATNTGTRSAATIEGDHGVAIVTGIEGRASGKKGCWLVLTERYGYTKDYSIKEVRAVEVDGKKVKEDTFYSLINGKVVEV